MSEISNSSFLMKILEKAEALRKSNNCQNLTRDYIVIAALMVIDECTEFQDSDEFQRTKELTAHLSHDPADLQKVLDKWAGGEIPPNEKLMLTIERGSAIQKAKAQNLTELTADIYLGEILEKETEAIKRILKRSSQAKKEETGKSGAGSPAPQAAAGAAAVSTPRAEAAASGSASQTPAPDSEPMTLEKLVEKTKEIENSLSKTVLGQQHAVNVFTEGFFQSELRAIIEKDRKQPRATFLFAGPPGVGKTFLSQSAANLLSIPFKSFNMSEYTNDSSSVMELVGADQNFKSSKEGLLTGFVRKNPRCVLLFDEIEKACIEVLHVFLQILDGGMFRDLATDLDVDFKDTILIFTTNAGKKLYDNENREKLSGLSRDVILDALENDVNPKTGEPFFPTAICSRFASGNVVMFNHLDAHTLHLITERQLQKHASEYQDALGITVNISKDVSAALLMAEGAFADARTIKSRADSFFSSEIYELYRLLPQDTQNSIKSIRTIDFRVSFENTSEEIKDLFRPVNRIHALAYTKHSELFTDDAFLSKNDGSSLVQFPIFHAVNTAQDAQLLFDKEPIRMLICDFDPLSPDNKSDYLNSEDNKTPERDFLFEMLKKHPDIPVILMSDKKDAFSAEEKKSFLLRGIYGFLQTSDSDFHTQICDFTETVFQQNNMASLARSNKLIHFETGQRLRSDNSSAIIEIFDMKLEKAIKAEDSENLLSLLSTPDVSFDDIIGADDAKTELKFFIRYMKEPHKFRRQGASSPKGILLYGPPGTGKTMLAKAFAKESGAAFIAVEGNRFYKKYIGEGADMVHNLFSTARKYAPSVIFIDEIDTIAKTRTGRDTDMAQDSEQILTALFSEMDGFSTDTSKPVFLLGATNYGVDQKGPMSLDPAMLRRFDRQILVDLPNKENRKKFLIKETADQPIFSLTDEGIESLMERSAGMSLALLASVLNMAVRTAIQKDLEYVTDSLLEEAFDTFNNGEQKKWNSEVTLRTARHEAGHTIISWLSGEKPSFVTIASRNNYGGFMQYSDDEDRMGYTREELRSRIRTALGGRAAELVYYGKEDGLSTGASGDLRTATELAKHMLCTYGMIDIFGLSVLDPNNSFLSHQIMKETNKILNHELEKAVRLITENKDKTDQLVDQLILHTSLREKDIDRILTGSL